MKKSTVRYLRLDETVLFEITIAGRLPPDWRERIDASLIQIESSNDRPLYRLRSSSDQAALQGILRSLYDFGMAIIQLEIVT